MEDPSSALFEALNSDNSQIVCQIIPSLLIPDGVFQSIPPNNKVFGAFPIPFLNIAAYFGSEATAKALINLGASVNAVDGVSNSAMHAAAASGSTNVIQELAYSGAEIDTPNADGMTPLHYACKFGHVSTAEWLISQEVDLDYPDNHHRTPSFYAASSGCIAILQSLSQNCADLGITDENNDLPLFEAISKGFSEAAFFIITHSQPSINWQGINGTTALHLSSMNGDTYLMSELIRIGNSPLLVDKHGMSAIHFAAQSGNADSVRYILSLHVIDPNLRDNFGNTPLHFAAASGSIDSVTALLSAGAFPNLQNSNLAFPIFLACRHCHIDIVSILLPKLGNANATDSHGRTLLHIAARTTSLDLIHELYKFYKFEPGVPDGIGWTPLHYAACKGSLAMVDELINMGADPTSITDDGRTAAQIAEKRMAPKISDLIYSKIPHIEEEQNVEEDEEMTFEEET